MYDMQLAKVERLARKMDLVQENTLNGLFEGPKLDISSLWELKNFGQDGSNQIYRRLVASKLRPQQGDEIVLQGAIESQIAKNSKVSNFQNLDVFNTLWNHFENRTSIPPTCPQHLILSHIITIDSLFPFVFNLNTKNMV